MSVISTTPDDQIAECKFSETESFRDETDNKVKEVWDTLSPFLILIGCFAVEAIIFKASLLFLVPILQIFLFGGIYIWYGTRPIEGSENEIRLVPPYIDPLKGEVPLVKSDAECMDLYQSYIDFAESASLAEVISEYEKKNALIPKSSKVILPPPMAYKAKLLNETGGLSYLRLVDEFSLAKLIRYSLIEPKELFQSFVDFAETAPLKSLIREHERGTKELSLFVRFSLPRLDRWKGKFKGETKEMKANQISFDYPLDDLLYHRLIDDKEFEILDQCRMVKDEYKRKILDSEWESSVRGEKEKIILDQARECADRSFSKNLLHDESAELYSQFLRDLREAAMSVASEIEAVRARLDVYEKTHALSGASFFLIQMRLLFQRKCDEIQQSLEGVKMVLKEKYLGRKVELGKKISEAMMRKAETYESANMNYREALDLIRENMIRLNQLYKEEMERQLLQVDIKYDAFRME